MSLNIKNEEAHRLAVELARLTGETLTQAVTRAIRERLLAERRRRAKTALSRELMDIGRRCAAHVKGTPIPHGDLLYDERGLPNDR